MRPHLTSNRYAVVTSTMALVIALGGGTAYAAGLITSKDIEDGGVKRVDLAKSAVNSRKVADGSLLKDDFRAGQIPAGPQGPAGAQGPAGQVGPSGPVDLVYVRTGPLSAEPGVVTQVQLFCPDGLSPTGGGLSSGGSGTAVSIHSSYPFDDNDSDGIPDNGWGVEVNNSGASWAIFAAYAVCGSASTVDEEYVAVTAAAVRR